MATSSTSYLQTLPHNQAIAFVAALQKVKEHLNQEIQWLNEQVQQKTTQLEGIETLLSEADASKSSTASASSSAVTSTSTVEADAVNATDTDNTGGAPANLQSSTSAEDAVAPTKATDSDTPETTASPAAPASGRQARGSRTKSKAAKPRRGAKQAAAKKTSAFAAKSAKSSTPSASKQNKPSEDSGIQKSLKSRFQDKPLLDAVSEILERAKAPLDADDILAKLYDRVPDEDYKRVKHTISNVLSMGKSKSKWKSVGRGKYASHAVTG